MRQMSFAAVLCSGGTGYVGASAEFPYLGFVMMSRAGAPSLQAYRYFDSHILAVEELAR